MKNRADVYKRQTLLRAQTTEPDGDMRGAIDAAVSYIERQILKNKTRLAKRLRSDAFPAVPVDDFSVAEESEFHIVRTKRFSVKPMSPEEAILQMNLLDHDFYVFRNSDEMCIRDSQCTFQIVLCRIDMPNGIKRAIV